MDVLQPLVDQTMAFIFKRGAHAAATIMPANDDVPNAQNVDGELEHRETIQVGMNDQVRDVAMDKDFARWQADNLVRGHAAVGASDPEILRRLLVSEALEEM